MRILVLYLSFIVARTYNIKMTVTRKELEKLIGENHEPVRSVGSEKLSQLLFLQNNYTSWKQLFYENTRKRITSISPTITISSEVSSCITFKQSRFDDEDNYKASDDIEIFFS